MDDYGITEAYMKAANKTETDLVEKKATEKEAQELKEAQEQFINEGSGLYDWLQQLAKATAANAKEGDKLCTMIEDWIVKYPRSYKSLKPFTKGMIMDIFEANDYIPMGAQEELDILGIKFGAH